MATALKLKRDINKLKAALRSKATPKSFIPKLKSQLEKAESDYEAVRAGKKTAPRASSQAKSTLDKLKQLIKKKKYSKYQGQGVDLERDADKPALPTGKRISKNGNTYYEYRANRIDVKQPPKRYPKLEEGGEMARGGKLEVGDMVMVDDSGYVKLFSGFDTTKPAKIISKGKTKSSGKVVYFYGLEMADGRKPFNNAPEYKLTKISEKGGYMAKGGEIKKGEKYAQTDDSKGKIKKGDSFLENNGDSYRFFTVVDMRDDTVVLKDENNNREYFNESSAKKLADTKWHKSVRLLEVSEIQDSDGDKTIILFDDNGNRESFKYDKFKNLVKSKEFVKADEDKMAKGGVMRKGARSSIKIKDWYIKNYPTDELGEEINDKITFKGYWGLTSQGYDPYQVLGVGDSVVRERVEEKLSEMVELEKGGYMEDGGVIYLESVGTYFRPSDLATSAEETFTNEGEIVDLADIDNEEWWDALSQEDRATIEKYKAKGGYMAKGGEISKEDIVILGLPRNKITEKEWASILRMAKYQDGATFILKDEKGLDVSPQVEYKWYVKEKMASGGYMAKGGELHKSQEIAAKGMFVKSEFNEILVDASYNLYKGLNDLDLAARYLEVNGQAGAVNAFKQKVEYWQLKEIIEKIDEEADKK